MPYLELNLAPAAEDMPGMALALIRAVVAAADQDKDEMTVVLIHGKPAAVIAPYGHERRPGAAAEIAFDQTAPPAARLVLKDTWGGSIRMSTGEFRQLARAGISSRFEAMAQIRRIVAVGATTPRRLSAAGAPPGPDRPGHGRVTAGWVAAGRMAAVVIGGPVLAGIVGHLGRTVIVL